MISSRWWAKKTVRKYISHSIIHIVLIILGVTFILPFYWMISTSLKIDPQIFRYPPIWIPNPVKWSNYAQAVTFIPFFTYLLNTLKYNVGSVIGVLFSCPLVAYSLARIPWRGRNMLFMIALTTMMLPFYVTMIPLFIIFKTVGWVGSLKPLVVPAFFGNAFFIFLLRQFFMTIPEDLSDAARIDGASEFTIFRRLIFPLSKPVLATVALFQFLASWNDFIGPLIYLHEEEQYTLSIGLQQFHFSHYTQYSLLMAASTIIAVPIVILYFFTQRTFIQGITLTGLKG